MSDLIDRQAVLDLIEHYNSDGLGTIFIDYAHGEKLANEVKDMPSVTPTDMSVIEDIKADVKKFKSDCEWAVAGDNDDCLKCVHGIFNSFYHIINKHMGETE